MCTEGARKMAKSLSFLRHHAHPHVFSSIPMRAASSMSRWTNNVLIQRQMPACTGVSSKLPPTPRPELGSILKQSLRNYSSHAYTDLLCSVENGIRRITFNRPSKKNALTVDMCYALIKALNESNEDETTTIIAITGSGDYFTSGMDMTRPFRSEMPTNFAPPPEDTIIAEPKGTLKVPAKRISKVTPFFNAFINCNKPIIALINGPAIGLGVTMLGLVDGVYSCESAFFQTKFTQFGVVPDLASTFTFPKIMGYCRTNKLLMNNEKISAREAYDYGLVSRIFTNVEFNQETQRILQEIATFPVKSLIYTKQLVREREKDVLRAAFDDEQQLFDPEMARKAKADFMATKK